MRYFTITSDDIDNALDNYNANDEMDTDTADVQEIIEFYEGCLEDDILLDQHYLLDTILSEILDSHYVKDYVYRRHGRKE